VRSEPLSSRVGLGLSPSPRVGLAVVPLGAALGPAGLNLLSLPVVDVLNPAVSVALAAPGVLAGLGLDFRRPREGRLLAAASLEAGVTILVVGVAVLVGLAKFGPSEAGLAINLERLGGRAAAIARMTAVTLAVAMAGLFAVAWIAWPWLPVAPGATGVASWR